MRSELATHCVTNFEFGTQCVPNLCLIKWETPLKYAAKGAPEGLIINKVPQKEFLFL